MESARELRAALLGSTEPAGAVRDTSPLPTARDLLEASPNLRRLCESYHRTHSQMLERGRRQRIGIAVLVAAVGVTAVLMARSGRIDSSALQTCVFVLAGMSCAALGLLAGLWVRDDARLRAAQGERLLRALQFNCTLPDDQLQAFRRLIQPALAFLDCYEEWLRGDAVARAR